MYAFIEYKDGSNPYVIMDAPIPEFRRKFDKVFKHSLNNISFLRICSGINPNYTITPYRDIYNGNRILWIVRYNPVFDLPEHRKIWPIGLPMRDKPFKSLSWAIKYITQKAIDCDIAEYGGSCDSLAIYHREQELGEE